MKSRAFTLIELLVVIAIIAILAAILFPVFAQAKVSAKGAASLSNLKQTSLAILMYTIDNDDYCPVDQTWGDSNSPLWFGTAGSEWRIWSWDILPYMKTAHILQDPVTSSEPINAAWGANLSLGYDPQYGYNYTALSPSVWGVTDAQGRMTRTPASTTSAGSPAGTVLMTAMTAAHLSPSADGWWWGAGTFITGKASEPVDCYNIPPACFWGWGYDEFWSNTTLGNSYENGAVTGYSAPRKGGQVTSAFLDGHVKYFAPGQLAAGTNWTRNSAAGVSIDAARIDDYLWDMR